MVEAPSTFLLLVRLSVSLTLVLGMVGGLTWFLRRRGLLSGSGSSKRRLEILDRKGIGRRSSIVVAKVGEVTLLLGVTDQGVTLLSDDPAIGEPWRTNQEPTSALEDQEVKVGTRRTGTPVSAQAVLTDSSGMSFIEALREMTVRRS